VNTALGKKVIQMLKLKIEENTNNKKKIDIM
jgi:hypothetical protein